MKIAATFSCADALRLIEKSGYNGGGAHFTIHAF
jgi:hypothetical protein